MGFPRRVAQLPHRGHPRSWPRSQAEPGLASWGVQQCHQRALRPRAPSHRGARVGCPVPALLGEQPGERTGETGLAASSIRGKNHPRTGKGRHLVTHLPAASVPASPARRGASSPARRKTRCAGTRLHPNLQELARKTMSPTLPGRDASPWLSPPMGRVPTPVAALGRGPPPGSSPLTAPLWGKASLPAPLRDRPTFCKASAALAAMRSCCPAHGQATRPQRRPMPARLFSLKVNKKATLKPPGVPRRAKGRPGFPTRGGTARLCHPRGDSASM